MTTEKDIRIIQFNFAKQWLNSAVWFRNHAINFPSKDNVGWAREQMRFAALQWKKWRKELIGE